MDNTLKYQSIIVALPTDYANAWLSETGVENQLILDKENHHYQLLMVGWTENKRYVHSLCFHLAIINGKVWLLENNTDVLIADELVERGIPEKDIVLGFVAPELRANSRFAVA